MTLQGACFTSQIIAAIAIAASVPEHRHVSAFDDGALSAQRFLPERSEGNPPTAVVDSIVGSVVAGTVLVDDGTGQKEAEIDTLMAKTYAALTGPWRGRWQSRDLHRKSGWTDYPEQIVFKKSEPGRLSYENKIGNDRIVEHSHIEGGVMYTKGTFNGEPYDRKAAITRVWFENSENWGYQARYVFSVDRQNYERRVIVVNMGDRNIYLRGTRKEGSIGDFVTDGFGAIDRVR